MPINNGNGNANGNGNGNGYGNGNGNGNGNFDGNHANHQVALEAALYEQSRKTDVIFWFLGLSMTVMFSGFLIVIWQPATTWLIRNTLIYAFGQNFFTGVKASWRFATLPQCRDALGNLLFNTANVGARHPNCQAPPGFNFGNCIIELARIVASDVWVNAGN